ncbi:hypothetical protein U7230_07470 [Carboxydochorda subterranea]|uniref:Uncharacterized protein n=1 Tax=Carboxydichorda subterranea TaxID=3109565 RepID=A0ABZ1C167_9FIRM|nr:hypothetical protein [Limnochorda sp. L945t]WRP18822.1 hypothetical protein U7230_07470 [Limnochorda sp. L945t]
MGEVIRLNGERAAAVRRKRALEAIGQRLDNLQNGKGRREAGGRAGAADVAGELLAIGRQLVALIGQEQQAAEAAARTAFWAGLVCSLEDVVDELAAVAAELQLHPAPECVPTNGHAP